MQPIQLIQGKTLLEEIYSTKINGKSVELSELLKNFINFMGQSTWNNFITSELLSTEDFRYAVFGRIEIAAATYYHSLRQALGVFPQIIQDSCEELGYNFDFAFGLAGLEKEIQLRVAFIDRYFYNIDHFIQVMNRQFSFANPGNTKRKQQVFGEMLAHFDLNDKYFTPQSIFELISNVEDEGNSEFSELMRDTSDRKIKYTDLYEFLANIRNSLHNNGFSNKTMNNLTLGQLKYEVKKDELLNCLSLSHLLALLFPLTKILVEVVAKSVVIHPTLLTDPFREEVKAFVLEMKSKST